MASRDPNKWLGLLKWSLQYHDSTDDSTAQPMSDEDKTWLKKFLEEHSYDEVGRMKEVTASLVQISDKAALTDEDDDVVQLHTEEVVDIVSQGDQAFNFHKIGCFQQVVRLLRSVHARIRASACELIATSTQNHEKMQEMAFKTGVLPQLTHLTVFDPAPAVRRMALYAVSCCIRGNVLAETAFIEEGDGILVLLRALLDHSDPKAQKRATYLLVHLASFHTKIVGDRMAKDGALRDLLEGIRDNLFDADLDLSEGVLQLLIALGRSSGENIRHFTEAGAEHCLNQRLSYLSAKSGDSGAAASVEIQHIREVLDLLSHPPANAPGTATSSSRAVTTSVAADNSTVSVVLPPLTPPPSAMEGGAGVGKRLFQATHEWQRVDEDHVLPHGLHIRMDLATGEKHAKLNDDREEGGQVPMAVVVAPTDTDDHKYPA